jgi:alpha/beta superfamily hydrolase
MTVPFPVLFTEPELTLAIPGPAGLLEVAVMNHHQQSVKANVYALLAHPHPLYGGTMQNKVVTTLARMFRDLGIVSVRFNYRGVGNSEGSYGSVVGECEDTVAVMNWIYQHNPSATLLLCGFSFGAYCALFASLQKPPRVLISIAPAIEHMPYEQTEVPACPWLIVQGGADEIVSVAATRAFVECTQPRPTFVELPEVGHFFHERLHLLRSTVLKYLPEMIDL